MYDPLVRCSLALALLVAGCGVTLREGRPPSMGGDTLSVPESQTERCSHGSPGPESPYREALPGAVSDAELLPYLSRFSAEVRRTAVAGGVEPLLARLMRERERCGEGPASDALVSMRLELAERLDTLETQLTAMEFECDCVRALLAEELAAYEEIETDRQLQLTIASLVVGAGVSVVAAAWDLANGATAEPAWSEGPLAISIAGAVATTALGAAVLVRTPREILYLHEHNLLEPIVAGDDPELLYPVFVFRLLTMPDADGSPAPRERLLETYGRLIGDAIPDDRRALAEAIVFRGGGVYDPGLLALHEELLEELGATLDSFARDVDLLSHTVAIVLESRPRAPAAPVDASPPAP